MKNNLSKAHTIALLVELRRRLITFLTVLFLLFALFSFFANNLYFLLARPLLRFLPQGHLIATQIVSPVFVPFKLAFLAAILVVVPFFLYQIWAFIAPALYGAEKKKVWPFLLLSGGLFYLGLSFAYFVIFPLLFQFIAKSTPIGVMFSPDIGHYLDFTIQLLLIFGVLFEIPMAMLLLCLMNIVTRARFIKLRRYAIVAAFILGALLAPPDVMSQFLLAVPIFLLYELGIWLTKLVLPEVKNPRKNSL